MNTRLLMTGLAALTLTVTIGANAFADEIYKWTDADGNIHYEDRPSGQPSEERLRFSYNRTDSSAVQQRVDSRREYEDAHRHSRDDAEADKQTAAEERAAVEERMAKCEGYRASLKTMLESRRVYREDDAGERTYLDDTQRAEARSKAENLIKETCG